MDGCCPLCLATAGADVLREGDYVGRRCARCEVVFCTPRPADDEVRAIYEHDDAHTASRQLLAKTRAPHATAHARYLMELLGAVMPPRKGDGLLELGPGSGLVLEAARAAGWEVAGIEPNPVLAAFLRDQQGFACEVEPLSAASFGARSFRAVVHVNVLSHLPDPLRVLGTVRERLGVGGWMLFETGNYAELAPRFLALVQRTERFQLPDHLYFYGERSLRELLDRAGFEVVTLARHSRVAEKVVPRILRALGLGRFADRWRFWLLYRLGAWLPKTGRPQALIVVARVKARS